MQAFSNCTNLETVTANPEVPPLAGLTVFEACSGLSAIKVPSASVAAYKAADGWSAYASLIVSQ
jgi:hypothetical protein